MKLTADGKAYTQPLLVKPDPRHLNRSLTVERQVAAPIRAATVRERCLGCKKVPPRVTTFL